MSPYDHLKSEQTRRDENIKFLIDNIKLLCDRDGLYPIKARKGNIYTRKCIQSNEGNIYKMLEREEVVGDIFK